MRCHQRVGRRDLAAALDHAANVGGGQALEHDPQGGADQLRERRRVAAGLLELEVAVGADDEDALVGDGTGDVGERQQRRLVGEVEVVEHHDEARALGGDLQQPQQGVVKMEAPLLGADRRRCPGRRHPELQVRHDRVQPGADRAQRLEHLRSLAAGGDGPHHLDPVPVRAAPPRRWRPRPTRRECRAARRGLRAGAPGSSCRCRPRPESVATPPIPAEASSSRETRSSDSISRPTTGRLARERRTLGERARAGGRRRRRRGHGAQLHRRGPGPRRGQLGGALRAVGGRLGQRPGDHVVQGGRQPDAPV